MLEIRSQWTEVVTEPGIKTPIFVLYMIRGEQVFNVAMDASEFSYGDEVLNCLTTTMTELIHKLYPEMQDPIYRLQRRIVKLDEEKIKILQMIKNIQKDDLVRFDEEEIKGVTE